MVGSSGPLVPVGDTEDHVPPSGRPGLRAEGPPRPYPPDERASEPHPHREGGSKQSSGSGARTTRETSTSPFARLVRPPQPGAPGRDLDYETRRLSIGSTAMRPRSPQ